MSSLEIVDDRFQNFDTHFEFLDKLHFGILTRSLAN